VAGSVDVPIVDFEVFCWVSSVLIGVGAREELGNAAIVEAEPMMMSLARFCAGVVKGLTDRRGFEVWC
jgi:hypothetical protein